MNDHEMLRVIEFVQQTRTPLRERMPLSDDDPIWNVTAFLMKNEIMGNPVTVASLVQVTGLPYTTSRRLVTRLIDEGHIVRVARTRTGKTFVLHPSKSLSASFRKYAIEVKSLIARTLGMRPTKETEEDYYFGGTPSLSQTMLPRNLFQKQYTENLELRFLLADDNYCMAMRNMWADLRCNLASRRNFDLLPPHQLYEKAAVNARAKTSEYDVVMVDMAWMGEFVSKGFVRRFGELQDAGVNPHGFDPIIWSTAVVNGVEYGVPAHCTVQVLAIRKDLFQDKSIHAPKTFDEVIEAGKAFHDPSKSRYGIVWDAARGMPVAQSFMFFMGACGSPILSLKRAKNGYSLDGADGEQLRALVDSDAGRTVLDYMHRLVDISPYDILEKAWEESLGVFLSGRAVMTYCETMRASRLEGDIHSLVRRKVQYLPQPTALGSRQNTPITSYLLTIPSNLQESRVTLAAEAISWMTSHDAMKAHVSNGFPIAPRFSVSADPESIASSPIIQVVDGFARRRLLQTWQRPAVPQYTAVEAVLGEEIHAALTREKSDADALKTAAERIDHILSRRGTTARTRSRSAEEVLADLDHQVPAE